MDQNLTLVGEDLAASFPLPDGSERPIFESISFRCRSGQLNAVVGPSGSGKTTLLAAIASDRAYSGNIYLEDEKGQRVEGPLFSKCFQRTQLVRYLKVNENLLLTRELAPTRQSYHYTIEDLLGLVGLGELDQRWPDTLSGGETARVGVIRSLVAEPDVLLVDEPTASLDRSSAESVVELLLDIAATIRPIIVVATHDPIVEAACSETIRLHADVLA